MIAYRLPGILPALQAPLGITPIKKIIMPMKNIRKRTETMITIIGIMIATVIGTLEVIGIVQALTGTQTGNKKGHLLVENIQV